jgi:regulator of sigma E protease
MPTDLIPALFSNIWAIFLIILFFGGSIFVHELGHFLAARRRGVHVARFSIGFGPKIFSWRGRDGVEYRISWLPLGGYVALPQLADMRGIEGESDVPVEQLAPISYATKMIVFGAGAVFNLLFAFVLASIIWFVGQPSRSELATTQIGFVVPTLTLLDGSVVPSPASQAGLRPGDIVRAIDGRAVRDWQELQQTLVISAGRTADGRRQNVFTIEREGQLVDVTIYPELAGDERLRRAGIAPAWQMIVHGLTADSVGHQVGLQAGDRLLNLDGVQIYGGEWLVHLTRTQPDQPRTLEIERDGQRQTLTVPAGIEETWSGVQFTSEAILVYPNPIEQFINHVTMTFRTLGSLLNPRSDIGISKLSGPVGIINMFNLAARVDIRLVLWFTILVNINLAIFNLLPIPVLDGGHMMFATIARLRRRPLPMNFILTTQSVFMVLLFTMILYVSFFDVRRIMRDNGPPPVEESNK